MKFKSEKFIFIILLSFVFLFIVAPPALADINSVDDITRVMGVIAYIFEGIVLTIGVIMIIAAGLVWMTAGANDDKLTKARKMLIWGLVGIAVALFSRTAQVFVESIM